MSAFAPSPLSPSFKLPQQAALEPLCALGQEVFDVARFEIKAIIGDSFYTLASLGLEDFNELGYHDLFDRAHRASLGLIIDDLTLHARTRHEPMVCSGPRLRFYADMPVFDQDKLLGIICLYDQLPNTASAQRLERQLHRFAHLAAHLMRPETVNIAAQPKTQKFGVFRLNLVTRALWVSPELLDILGFEPNTVLGIDDLLRLFARTDAETMILAFWRSVSQGEDFDLILPTLEGDYAQTALIIRGGIEQIKDGQDVWLCAVVSQADTLEDNITERDVTRWHERVKEAVMQSMGDRKNVFFPQAEGLDGIGQEALSQKHPISPAKVPWGTARAL